MPSCFGCKRQATSSRPNRLGFAHIAPGERRLYNISLYAATVLIWGSTWIAITYQLNGTAEEVSVAIRFILAALVLFGIGRLTGRRVWLPRSALPMVAIQGALMFCGNYFLVYYGTNYITSGLMAVIFTVLIPANLINEYLFFRSPVSGQVALAGVLGVAGVALIFWPEVTGAGFAQSSMKGVLLGLGSVYLASLGNMAAVANTRKRLPVLAVNAWGMLFGGVLSFGLALATGRSLHVNLDTGYVATMIYLSVFGSAVAFSCYLVLMDRIGSAKAAYSTVLLPIVALLISTLFEDFHWSLLAVAGLGLAVVGNLLALTARAPKFSATLPLPRGR